MNGKQARNLRKLVQKEAGSLPKVRYTIKTHPERLVQVVFSTNGNPQYDVVAPETVVLIPGCQRRLYQQSKKLHHTFYGR